MIEQDDIKRVERIKEKMEDMLEELSDFARRAKQEPRFNAYVKGHIESALEDFTGMGNYSVEALLEDMRDVCECDEE